MDTQQNGMANRWLDHLKKFYAANKDKYSYSQAMKMARASYKKTDKAKSPKKKRRRRK